MQPLALAPHQAAVAALPADRTVFLEGPAGTGKTTAAVARLLHLLEMGIPAGSILVLVPQRTLASPYREALRGADVPAGGEVTMLTMGGVAQRMVELFWPMVAGTAGFAFPDRPPTFLTLETAQYYMARLVRPLLEQGYFESVVIDRNRLYSQVLDNLNKAAVVGFPHGEIAARLKAAWVGESSQVRVYDEAQDCATRFRQYCLGHNLLDFSLQYEVFLQHLWPMPACRDYLLSRYTHLIVDNIEEDTPVAHDLLAEWLSKILFRGPDSRSALLIYDDGAGYRRFLGADPQSAYRLKASCREHVAFSDSYAMSPDMETLLGELGRALGHKPQARLAPAQKPAEQGDPRAALDFTSHRYHPEMLDWVAERIADLVHDQGVPPREIAVLAPFLSGALRFSLTNKLAVRDVAVRSHRPSRALREEPATGCLLTLAALCHPQWGIFPKGPDVAHALMLAVDEMDLVRAQLLVEVAYRTAGGAPGLGSFSEIEPEMQERITFLLGGRFEGLRDWVIASAAGPAEKPRSRKRRRSSSEGGRRRGEFDHFLGRLFGELLSQPGYGFHRDYDAGEITANLIESARKFRQVMALEDSPPGVGPPTDVPAAEAGKSLAQEYVELVQDGVVAAQYVRSWQRQPEDAVLLAPAYTFLMANRPVDHQFWLDVGGTGWWERLYQPLTHPYVLSRAWTAGTPWTDAEEYAARQDAMACLVLGLIRRCRVQIHLGLSEMGEQGNEQRGPLLQAMQQVLRRLAGDRRNGAG
jgi:hypothetical protein